MKVARRIIFNNQQEAELFIYTVAITIVSTVILSSSGSGVSPALIYISALLFLIMLGAASIMNCFPPLPIKLLYPLLVLPGDHVSFPWSHPENKYLSFRTKKANGIVETVAHEVAPKNYNNPIINLKGKQPVAHLIVDGLAVAVPVEFLTLNKAEDESSENISKS